MGDKLYSQGEQLQVNCSSNGGPVLEYTWLHSGNIIPNANTNVLTITNVNTTHGGEYICNVTNNAGYDSKNITVYGKLLYDLLKLHFYMYISTYVPFNQEHICT